MRFGLNQRIGRGVRAGLDSRPTYTPTVEGNLVLWFDLQDPAAYTTSGGVITQLTNKVSSVAWTAAGSARAAFDATGLNGFPCAHPDGINDAYTSTESAVVAALDATATAQPYTLIWVAAPDDVDNNNVVLGAGNPAFSSNNTRRWGQSTNVTGRYQYAAQSNSGVGTAALYDFFQVTTAATMVTFFGQTTHTVQPNLRTPRSAVADPVSCVITQVSLFSRPDAAPDLFWAGKFGELMLFNAIKSADARARLQDYVTGKWKVDT